MRAEKERASIDRGLRAEQLGDGQAGLSETQKAGPAGDVRLNDMAEGL